MAKSFVYLTYNFLFDPTSTWSNLSQFESDLNSFMVAHGMEVEIVKSLEGQLGNRIMLISRSASLASDPVQEKTKQEKSDPILQNRSEKKVAIPKGGTFAKDKGGRKKTRKKTMFKVGRILSQKVADTKLGGQ